MKGQGRHCHEGVPWQAGDSFHSFIGMGPFYSPSLLVFNVNRGAAVVSLPSAPCFLSSSSHPPNLENAKGLSLGEEQR